MAISDYGVDAVLVLARGYVQRAVARVVDGMDLCALRGIIPALGTTKDYKISTSSDWMFRFGGLSFAQTDTGVEIQIQLATTCGQAKVNGSVVDMIRISEPLSFSGAGTTLRVTFERFSFGFDVDLSSLQVGDVQLAFPSEDPATAKVLTGGSLAIGLIIDVADTGGAFSLAARGGPPPMYPIYVQPATVDFARFRNDFNLDNHHSDWALGLDQWLLDALVRASPIKSEKLRVRLRVTQASEQGLTLAGRGEAYHKDDWWDVSVKARAEIQLVNGSFQVAWTLTKAEAGPFDKDVLDDLKKRGRQSGTIAFPLPAQIGDPKSSIGALSVSAVSHGDGLLRMQGTGTARDYVEANAIVLPRMLDFGRELDGQPARTSDRIYIRNAHARLLEGKDRLRLHVCTPKAITGARPESFSISAPPPGTNAPPLAAGNSASWQVEFRGEAGQNHEAEVVFLTSDGRHVVTLRALLAPASIELSHRRSAPKQYVRCDMSSKFTNPQRHADFIVTIRNAGPGNAALLGAQLVDATGARFQISWFEAPLYYDTPGLSFRDGKYSFSPHVIPPDRAATLGIDFELERDDRSGSVKLVLETTEGPRELSFSTAEESEQSSINVAKGPLVASLDLQTFDRICFEFGKMETLGVREQLADFQQLLEGLPTDCCPPPAQPMCLCANMADLAFAELPPKVVLEIGPRGDDGVQPWTRWTSGGEGNRVLAPYDPEQGVELRISGAQGAFIKGALRRWTASRVGRVMLDRPVTGATWTDGGVAVLADDRLLHYRIDANRIEQIDEHVLGWRPTWISGADGLVAVGGVDGVTMFEARRERLVDAKQSQIGLELGAMSYVRALDATRLIGVRNDRISVLEAKELRVQHETDRPEGSIRAAVPLRRGALLFADDKVELMRFASDHPQPLGQATVPSAHSVMVIGSLVYAVDRGGVGSVLHIGGRALESRGQVRFPAGWSDLLPGGAVAFRGRQLVAARADAKGFNVFRFTMGKADLLALTGAFSSKKPGPQVVRPTIDRTLITRPLPTTKIPR